MFGYRYVVEQHTPHMVYDAARGFRVPKDAEYGTARTRRLAQGDDMSAMIDQACAYVGEIDTTDTIVVWEHSFRPFHKVRKVWSGKGTRPRSRFGF